MQLQDFPAPPPRYRSQEGEPELTSDARVRAITGFSGGGKTMWVAQTAQHCNAALAYFDVGDTPGPAITIPLARELAGRFFGSGGGLGRLLLPGATGTEMLRAIGLRLHGDKIDATIVIDNAHRVPAENLRTLVQQTPHARFIFLAQPGPTVQELQATLGLRPEPLGGWATDMIGAEAADSGCIADYAACERLRNLTAGLPLYVQNAMQIAGRRVCGRARPLLRRPGGADARCRDRAGNHSNAGVRGVEAAKPRRRGDPVSCGYSLGSCRGGSASGANKRPRRSSVCQDDQGAQASRRD